MAIIYSKYDENLQSAPEAVVLLKGRLLLGATSYQDETGTGGIKKQVVSFLPRITHPPAYTLYGICGACKGAVKTREAHVKPVIE
jgi:hypothetical protein